MERDSLVVVAALQDEVALLKKGLSIDKTYHRSQATFYQGVYQGVPVIVGATGMGAAATEGGLEMLFRLVQVAGAIGVGSVGGLVPTLGPGALVLASEICRAENESCVWRPEGEMVAACRQALAAAEHPWREGRVVTVARALTSPSEKEEMHERSGAIAVDMESEALAEVCHRHGVPFVVLRAVLDPVTMAVPDPAAFVDRGDRVAKRKVFSYIAGSPQEVWRFPELVAHAHRARRALQGALSQVIPALSRVLSRE